MSLEIINEETNRVQFLVFLILSLALVYFAYSPSIYIPFYHHDTYKFISGSQGAACSSLNGYEFLHNISRPFSAYLDCLNYKTAYTIQNMGMMRLACIIGTGILSAILAYFIYQVSGLFILSLGTSITVFMLPAIQTSIIMGATFFQFALLASFMAYFTFSRALYSSQKRIVILCYMVATITLLLVSLFTYPSLSPAFLLFSFIKLIYSSSDTWQKNSRYFIASALIYGLSAIIFFIMAKWHQYNLFIQYPKLILPDSYKYNVNFTTLPEKFIILFNKIPTLWSLYPGTAQMLLVTSCLLFGIISVVSRAVTSVTPGKVLGISTLIIIQLLITFIASNATYLAAPDMLPSSRIIFVFQAIICISLIWSLYQIVITLLPRSRFILSGGVMSVLLISMIISSHNIATSALNDNIELNYITTTLLNYLNTHNSKLSRIHFVRTSVPSFNGNPAVEDIFNIYSTGYREDVKNIATSSLSELISKDSIDIVDCASIKSGSEYLHEQKKCVDNAPAESIVVTYSLNDEKYYSSKNMLTIDMNALALLAYHPNRKMEIDSVKRRIDQIRLMREFHAS